MADKMDMSLDAIIDEKRSSERASRGPRRNRGGQKSQHKQGNDRPREKRPQRQETEITSTITLGSYNKEDVAMTDRATGGAFRRSRRGGKSNPYRQRRDPEKQAALNDENTLWEHDRFEDVEDDTQMEISRDRTRPQGRPESGTKLSISNLEYSVAENTLQQLFSDAATVKKVFIHYDRSGRSEGTGEVIFETPEGAAAALAQCNGVELDGKRIRLAYAPASTFSGRRGRGRFGGPRRSFIRGRGGRGRGRNY